MTIAESMLKARKMVGLSQYELESVSGVNASCISKYESGKSSPSINAVVALADALGISVDEYIGHQVKVGNERDPIGKDTLKFYLTPPHKKL